jgi:hypothetical protein
VAQLNLATRVDMVVLCLLSWYDSLTPERKASFGQKGPEVPRTSGLKRCFRV